MKTPPPRFSILVLSLMMGFGTSATAQDGPELLGVEKIWDKGRHNAFTDLIRFDGRWYCVFREAEAHVSPEGKIRVLVSEDGRNWNSTALLAWPDADLRDPKICEAPDGRLMLLAAASWHGKDVQVSRQPMVWFSEDGRRWGEGADVGEKDYWLWSLTWRKDRELALGVGYRVNSADRHARLYSTRGGMSYETLVPNLHDKGYPNESSIVFNDDQSALCLLRRDGSPNSGLLGVAMPPYTEWQWKDLGVRIGGPRMIRLADGRLLAAVRLYDGGARTSLCWIDPRGGKLTEALRLPSGGDTSYAGMVQEGDVVWVSYYSSHEGRTSIYLARVRI